MVGGASKLEAVPGLSKGLGSLTIGETDLLPAVAPPKLKGKAGREKEGILEPLDPVFSFGSSSSGPVKPLCFGLVGFMPSFGDVSFEGRRGVNEWERA